jgi:FkbM family methyltransferase
LRRLINFFKIIIRDFLQNLGIEIRRYEPQSSYHEAMSLMLCKHQYAVKKTSPLEKSFIESCVNSYPTSYSQREQDLFAVWANLHEKKSRGFCIEFGAGDGLFISNTAHLSKNLNWHALLIEPNPRFFKRLVKNRRNDTCIQGAVAGINDTPGDKVKFREAGLLTLQDSLPVAENLKSLFSKLETKTFEALLWDLNKLIQNSTKSTIVNYMSVDTEGSELEILQTIDFNKYSFNALSIECEEAKKDRAEKICLFLSEKGYERVFSYGITGVDLWFLRNDHPLLNLSH